MLQLDYLQHQASIRISTDEQGEKLVFDPIRRKNIVLTPEELLRQLVLNYLLQTKNYPANRIRVEIGILINDRPKRCDILVFDTDLKPWLLVECKSPKVAIGQTTMEQASRYNLSLRAPFLAITNGLATYSCSLDLENGDIQYLNDYPEWNFK